jgi:hypothetical protein
MWKRLVLATLIVAAGAAGALVEVGGDVSDAKPAAVAKGIDLSPFPAEAPPQPVDLVFLYHSAGEQLLADRGISDGQQDILSRHPNGGGLAALLAKNNYRLHEGTYGSKLGERTDLFDWLPKFQFEMAGVLSVKRQDESLPPGQKNRVVMFSASFSDNEFVAGGEGGGNPDGPELTEANARATMKAVREELAKRPEVLFVYLTGLPLAPKTEREPAWSWLAKKALHRPSEDEALRKVGEIARSFNNWMSDPAGWLAGYPLHNIVVFDAFDVLTGHGTSNFSVYASGDGWDPHPTADGNAKVAAELVPFLNRAVRYAGIVK